MTTVNISLPDKLKQQVDTLVKDGYYASLSDLMREGARSVLRRQEFLEDLEESRQEFKSGNSRVLHSLKDLR